MLRSSLFDLVFRSRRREFGYAASPAGVFASGDAQLDHTIMLLASMARPPAVCTSADIPCPRWLFRWGPVCKFIVDGLVVKGSPQLLPVCVLGAVRDLLKKTERSHRGCQVVSIVGYNKG